MPNWQDLATTSHYQTAVAVKEALDDGDTANALRLFKFHVDWTTPANSTFTGPTTLSTAAYNQLCPSTRNCVDQPSTTVNLDCIGDRLMYSPLVETFRGCRGG